MTDQRGAVVAGVDAHTDEHHAAVLDTQGRLLGAAAFPTTADGYEQLIRWLRKQGAIDRVGVESTGAYAAKRTADGLNKREILRCLKRYIARQTYHTLRADLDALNSA